MTVKKRVAATPSGPPATEKVIPVPVWAWRTQLLSTVIRSNAPSASGPLPVRLASMTLGQNNPSGSFTPCLQEACYRLTG